MCVSCSPCVSCISLCLWISWLLFGSRCWQWTQGVCMMVIGAGLQLYIYVRFWCVGPNHVSHYCLFSVFLPFLSSFSGTMLTAHLRSPSSARSTSAGAASCSVRMPSVALSRGCAGSICVCAVSCSPCVTGLCQSRAASEPAVCAVPAPHWIAWRLGAFRNREKGSRNVDKEFWAKMCPTKTQTEGKIEHLYSPWYK